MKENDVEKHKIKLLQLRSELEMLEKSFKESNETVVLDQTRMGRLSRMDAMQAQQMALESDRRRQQQLLKIEGALHRIETDDYGYCFICDEEIDIRRLAADPTSTRCLECVEK